MRISSSSTALVGLLALISEALAANVVHMSFTKRDPQIDVMSNLGASLFDRAISEELFNNVTGGSYMASVKVGTPAQDISLVIDTGSSDTWLLSKNADECSVAAVAYKYGGCVGGTFDFKASNSFKSVAPAGFNISYADGSGSTGDYFTDNLQIGGATIKDLQMGLALKTTTSVGIMGIAYPVGESVTKQNQYPNIMDQMVSQKLINLRAYSLWLDDKESSTGSVLFGGIDTEKFIGTLKSIPVEPDTRTKTIRSFTVYMTGLSVTDDGGTSTALTGSGYTLPVILDSGTTITYVPAKLLAAIIQSLGAVDDTGGSGYVLVDCDWRTTRNSSFLSFSFGGSGGPTINVPLSELIRSFTITKIRGSPFTNTCGLGISTPASGSTYLFGDTFLRSAYVVYDIDHDEIALAQTNFEATGSNIQDIPSSATGIPLLSGKSSGQTTVPLSHFTGKPSTTGTNASKKTSQSSTTVDVFPDLTTNTASATGTAAGSNPTAAQSSKAAAVGSVPAFDHAGLLVLLMSSIFALAGGSWFLVC